ncbi:MAG: hypothetical protein ACYC05_04970 [Sulfuricella sp.]
MTQLSLSAAARAAGISRSTLHEHIAAGKVSVQIDGQGRRTVDTSELLRVYGRLVGAPDTSSGQNRTGADSITEQVLSGRVAVLEAEVRGFQALLQEKDARIEELHHTVRLLEYKRATAPAAVPAESRAGPGRPMVPKPVATKLDRTPMIIIGAVALLAGLALTLQSLQIIRLG